MVGLSQKEGGPAKFFVLGEKMMKGLLGIALTLATIGIVAPTSMAKNPESSQASNVTVANSANPTVAA